jgi:uncharacterized DUF497 family protein
MFIWDDWNTRHIARHNILPHEAEEVIDGDPFDLEVQIVNGEERVLSIGETKAGRVLMVVAAWVEEQQAIRVVTVFEPSAAQRKEYAQWSGLKNDTTTKDTGVQEPRGRSRVVGRESDDG